MRQERPLGHGQGAEPHETETLAEGVLMSSGIDFVFQASALYLLFVFFHFYLFSFAVASLLYPPYPTTDHCILVCVALSADQQ